LLGQFGKDYLPEPVRARVEKNALDNADRFRRITEAVAEISTAFGRSSVDFCVLKGFAHSPELTPDPLLRAQGDIDLWCLPARIERAKEILLELGYRPAGTSKGRHLDPMIKPTEWQWRGDYFARDLPIPVDLHFTLWDEKLEFMAGPDEQTLWQRRVSLVEDGRATTRLDLADTLLFAVLHFMMHLLHGDLRLQRAWEIGHFLHSRSADAAFWTRWEGLYSQDLLKMQAIAFDLARQWFGCELALIADARIEALPEDVRRWLDRFGSSPIKGLFAPNKDEVWLNLCLLKSPRDKARVLVRRLLPKPQFPVQTDGGSEANAVARRFFWKRCLHHLRTFHSTCLTGLEWYLFRWRIERGFLTFLLVSVLFDFGEFVFFLLYNLYLLERGFDEKFIGQVSACLTAGTFVGAIFASAIARRLGLRTFVILAMAGAAGAAVCRSLALSPSALFASAFVNGLFLSFWAVCMPPAVSHLTDERSRTFGFSLISCLGIGTGAVAGLLGGRLPTALLSIRPALTSVAAKETALLIGSALAGCAIFPAMFLRFPAVVITQKLPRKHPHSSFLRAFLLALFLWTLGTSGFNPFFSVFFSKRLHATVEQVGLTSSYSQMAQVGAILLAPKITKQMGVVRGISAVQLATAASLAMLGFVTSLPLGSLLYVVYMSLQYMTEPCLLSTLMTRVEAGEREGASSLNFLIISLAGIIAATGAGNAMTQAGYSATILVLAVVTALSAVVFRLIVRD
jgi:predicted MFS family arabinose efflux permease